MISIQSYRLAIGLFKFKIKCFKDKSSTYDDFKRGERGGIKFNLILIYFLDFLHDMELVEGYY